MADNDDLELTIRTGSPSVKLTRDEFRERFRAQFFDPAFERVRTEIRRLQEVETGVRADYRAFLRAALDRLESDTKERQAAHQAA